MKNKLTDNQIEVIAKAIYGNDQFKFAKQRDGFVKGYKIAQNISRLNDCNLSLEARKCECVDVEMGSFSNAIKTSVWWSDKVVFIDKCIYDEIMYLWGLGIMTSGCCCGHKKDAPMINVFPEFHESMIALGYTFCKNEFDTVCYNPKSITA